MFNRKDNSLEEFENHQELGKYDPLSENMNLNISETPLEKASNKITQSDDNNNNKNKNDYHETNLIEEKEFIRISTSTEAEGRRDFSLDISSTSEPKTGIEAIKVVIGESENGKNEAKREEKFEETEEELLLPRNQEKLDSYVFRIVDKEKNEVWQSKQDSNKKTNAHYYFTFFFFYFLSF